MKEIAKKEKWKIFFDFIITPCDNGNRFPLKNRISNLQIKKAYKLQFLPFVTRAGNPRLYKNDGLCYRKLGKSSLFINNDGYVFPNMGVRINIGNLKRDALRDIWLNSRKLNQLRNLKLEDFECSQCKYLFNCRWDPGLALVEHDNLFKTPKEYCRFTKFIAAQKIS